MNTPKPIGIDLGTTFSSVAWVNDAGLPEIIPNAEGNKSTASVVKIVDGDITVGQAAMNEWATDEAHVVRWIKRAMGSADFTFQEKTPVEISAEILKVLKADAESVVGEIGEVVITCPAWFNGVEVKNTRDAGRLAGLNVREVVKEPTAAAVSWGVENMSEGQTVLVCDLGGGTYDATILRLESGVFVPLSTCGERELGGHDWTMSLAELVGSRVMQQHGFDIQTDPAAWQMLYEACESAKRGFASMTQAAIACRVVGRVEQIMVTRDEFEVCTEGHIQHMLGRTIKALDDASPKLEWKDIGTILLVGGSSRLRRLAVSLEEASGRKPVQAAQADFIVALGAAIIAAGRVKKRRAGGGLVEDKRTGLIEGISPVQVLARECGTRALTQRAGGRKIVNSIIIPRGTAAPVKKSNDEFAISHNGQRHIDVPVVEFEAGDEDGYETMACFRFHCPPGAKSGDRVKVVFEYDRSLIPTVGAFDLKSGQAMRCEEIPYVEGGVSAVPRARRVVFAIDTSYSMDGSKLRSAKTALLDNARQLFATGGDIEVGVVSFSDSARVVCRLTSSIQSIESSVGTMQATGTTWMDEGIRTAIRLVLEPQGDFDRDVVMLTDGMPDDDRRDSTLHAAAETRAKGVTLSTVGVGQDDVDATFLGTLSPNSLVINSAGDMSGAMSTLLTQSAARRGGLLEP